MGIEIGGWRPGESFISFGGRDGIMVLMNFQCEWFLLFFFGYFFNLDLTEFLSALVFFWPALVFCYGRRLLSFVRLINDGLDFM